MDDLDRLVNACLLPGFAGAELPRWAAEALDAGLAGVTLYGANLVDSEAVPRLAGAVRGRRADALVALDEEGGDVTRLDYRTGSRYPGNLALGRLDDVAATAEVAAAIGADLSAAGVNVNLAPTVDVNSDPRNPVIGVRSFGAESALVARHAAAFVRGLQGAGVAAVAKHFPGHGATVADSHLELPVIDCDEATFRRRELPPFAAAIDAGALGVMTSHVLFPALDQAPATVSRPLLTDLLRGELGFTGVVVTDALDMAAVRGRYGIAGAAVRSLAAGADLLLVGAEDGERHCADIRGAVRAAVRDRRLTVDRLQDAADRVHRLRAHLVAAATAATAATAAPAPRPGVGLAVARRAVEARGHLPVTAPAVVVELRGTTNLAVGDAGWSLAEPMATLGMLADVVTVGPQGPSAAVVAGCAAGRPLVLAVRDAYRTPWQRDWVDALLAHRPDAVLVALGMPEDAELGAGATLLAFGAGQVNALAAAERLSSPRAC